MEESLEIAPDPQKSVLPEKLRLEDQLKHYQEGRTDVRAYATFLIQIITLLLTTMILVMGWVAKDYATEKYRLAQRSVIPDTTALQPASKQSPSSTKPVYELPPKEAAVRLQTEERKFTYINQVYWHQLIYSPTTSILLAGFSIFTLLVLGLLIAITYQLQRRRYHYHALGLKLGLENDQPVADAILIRGALNDLMILIGIGALGLVFVTAIQIVLYILHSELLAVKVGLLFLLSLVAAKTVFVSRMVQSYTHFERTEGWMARWRRARHRIEDLQAVVAQRPDCPIKVTETLARLSEISTVGGKDKWLEAGNLLHVLLSEVREAQFGSHIEDCAQALIMELRHNKVWRRPSLAMTETRTDDEIF